MRDFYRWELAQFEDNRTPGGALLRTGDKLARIWQLYLGPALSLPLLAFPWMLRDRRMRFPLVAMGVFVAGLSPQTWTLPHYFAPATSLLYLIVVQCMRHMRLWKGRHSDMGAAAVRLIVAVSCAMCVLRLGAVISHTAIEPAWPRGNLDRVAVIEQLNRSTPGTIWSLFAMSPAGWSAAQRPALSGSTTRPTSIPRRLSGPAIWATAKTRNYWTISKIAEYGG